MKTYELTVYHTVDNVGYAILHKSFTDVLEMVRYCMDFDNSDDDLLFDVWVDADREQFNINNAVWSARVMRNELEGMV